MTKASHLPFTCCLLPGQEESTRVMSERGSRVVANEEELKVMERSKVDLKEQPMDGGASKEQRARRTNCLRLPECRRSTRDAPECMRCTTNVPEMRQNPRDVAKMRQSCTRDAPGCGRCTICQMHLTMAAIVSLQNQLFRGSRSHGL